MSTAKARWGLALTGVLALSLGLRLWGLRHGLPYAYNSDENGHFVPKAIAFFGSDLNPHYFTNPPAFSYLLRLVFGVWFGGRANVSHTFANDPTAVFAVARGTAAVLSTIAVGLVYMAGARLLDRRVGLLAAGLLGVAFLPVFYSHLALNDAPTLAPVALSLYGAAGVLRLGRPIDYLIAGAGVGLACATKYTGGIVLVALIAAAGAQYMARDGRLSAVTGLAVAGAAALAAFVIANPYAALDFESFRNGLIHQSQVSGDSAGKLGVTERSGIAYYLWTLTWGLGWVPAIAALGGAIALWRDERRLVAVLVPPPLLFLLFMGLQGRYFGRWLMPIFPFVCLLAAYGAFEAVNRLSARRPALRPTLVAVAVAAICGQALLYSVHIGLVLSRADTRNLTRAWLVAHVTPGTKIIVEPVVPDQWALDIGHSAPTPTGYRWAKFPTSRAQVAPDGSVSAGSGPVITIEDYERTLRPELIAAYAHLGYCWLISGSTQAGRAAVAPSQVPRAIDYYRALGSKARLVYQATPFGSGSDAVPFNFDWTFDYYPLAYHRPGPVMTVYHLRGALCRRLASR